MNWGLAAGAVSRGVTDAMTGLNQGMLQGEGVRANRFQEGLQQQHLQMQQQQLQNALVQQAFSWRVAEANLKLYQQHYQNEADRLSQQFRYQQGMLDYHNALVSSQVARNQVVAGWNTEWSRIGAKSQL